MIVSARTLIVAAAALVSVSGAALLSPAVTASAIVPAGASTSDACTRLTRQTLGQALIESAKVQPANTPVEGAPLASAPGMPSRGNISGLPSFCRVIGAIRPEAGSNIRFEVWLPAAGWNGRFMGAGNGGLAGTITHGDLASAVSAGFATASTDTGHSGAPDDSSWAKGNPAKVRDYGWRAMHLTTVTAKTLIQRFYGRPADKSYFASCSNGGRMGLMEASRFPDDYDGIMAGAPASGATKLIMSHIWLTQAQQSPGAAIRTDQVKLLQSEVLAQCDGIDGRADGIVDDPRQCRFDAAKLACGTNSSAQCFTPPQLDALRKIHQGPRDSTGRRIGFGFPATGAESGAPIEFFGWEGAIAKGDPRRPIASAFPDTMLNLPRTPIASDKAFDFDRDPARVTAALASEIDPQPDLRRYFARGGKLIMWHGWADATIPPQHTLAFHQGVLDRSGPRAKTQMQLFMVPGVQHCFGGPGAGNFGQLAAPMPGETPDRSITAALIDWVEKGRRPETLIGRLGFDMMGGGAQGPEKQRLICAYPARAVLTPGADPDSAASYTCRPPRVARH